MDPANPKIDYVLIDELIRREEIKKVYQYLRSIGCDNYDNIMLFWARITEEDCILSDNNFAIWDIEKISPRFSINISQINVVGGQLYSIPSSDYSSVDLEFRTGVDNLNIIMSIYLSGAFAKSTILMNYKKFRATFYGCWWVRMNTSLAFNKIYNVEAKFSFDRVVWQK